MVLGSVRSGTSSVSAVLSRLGVYFGAEEDLYGANEFNPKGHFELSDMQQLHIAIAESFGLQFYSGRWLPENWKEWPAGRFMVQHVGAMLKKHFRGRPYWGYKDPLGSVLVPVYRDVLSIENLEASFAICIRHPLSVLTSMRTRSGALAKDSLDDGPLAHSRIDLRTMGLWLYYTLASLRDTKGSRRLVIGYENFLENPRQHVETIVKYFDLPATREQLDDAAGSVDPNLSHSRFAENALDEWPGLVKRLYGLGLRAALDPEKLNNGAFDEEIDSLWDEWLHLRTMIRPDQSLEEKISLSWQDQKGLQQSIAFAANFEDGMLRIRVPISMAPGSSLNLHLFNKPCQVWIKRALWRTSTGERAAVLRAGPNGIIEDVYGVKLVIVLGPGHLTIDAPSHEGTLEIDCLIESDTYTLVSIVGAVRDHLERLNSTGMR